jgi:hypothetical protein
MSSPNIKQCCKRHKDLLRWVVALCHFQMHSVVIGKLCDLLSHQNYHGKRPTG